MKNLIIGFIVLAITLSCNSSNDDVAISNSSNVDTTPILPTSVFVYSGNSISYSLKYSYVGSKIKEIIRDNLKYIYTYNGNNITKEEWSVNGEIKLIKEFSYLNDRVSSVKVTNKITSPAIVYTKNIEYVNDFHIKYNEYDLEGNLVSQIEAYFDSKGNQINIISKLSAGTIKSVSTFDNKNNPFKNIIGYAKIKMIDENAGGLIGEGMSGSNNLLKRESDSSLTSYVTCTYVYNALNNYPKEQSRKYLNEPEETIKYYYNKL
ncbi:hypothetical protein [Chryseobacterium potabilaquae]|uniref:DUF4595 domain-containing protein n=1 Tax=Chryseobacterium potabilaquae TaxID=2675057 RepID=A0A6N4X972_9FLAO|nr:hypothetical protein [Chryseobacterium potabilaquae]CAA7197616.1 hypothetical protein CHRY9293_03689 [Chryseobacterium potabilaquae]